MKIALIQQKATGDKYANLKKGLAATGEAARNIRPETKPKVISLSYQPA